MSLIAAGVESDLRFQTLEINGKPSIRRYSPAPPAFNVCACSVVFNCLDPLYTAGRFICQYGDNCMASTVVWQVPGMSDGCSYYERYMNSDLRCFYNQTCINVMLSMFNVDMPHRLPLPDAAFRFTPLSSVGSKFQPATKLESIFRDFMLEEWKILPYYAGHYHNCAPGFCTYTITSRSEPVYVISTIISFFGGLVVVLRLLVPMLVRFTYWIGFRWCHRRPDADLQHGVSHEGNIH